MAPDRVLITGGRGQLGKALALQRPEAVVLTRAELDVTDAVAVHTVIRAARPDVVIHAAAYTKVDAAESDPHEAERVNSQGTRNVASACSETGALLVYPSTDYVFSGDAVSPYRETDTTAPLSVYGRTKLMGEQAASRAPDYLIVRTSWVFGDGHNFIRTMLRLGESRRSVQVVADQRGRPTYAPDLARGVLGLIEAAARGIFHLTGQGRPASWADVAERVFGAARLPVEVERITSGELEAAADGPVAPRPRNSTLDCGKASACSVTLRPWEQAVDEYVSGQVGSMR